LRSVSRLELVCYPVPEAAVIRRIGSQRPKSLSGCATLHRWIMLYIGWRPAASSRVMAGADRDRVSYAMKNLGRHLRQAVSTHGGRAPGTRMWRKPGNELLACAQTTFDASNDEAGTTKTLAGSRVFNERPASTARGSQQAERGADAPCRGPQPFRNWDAANQSAMKFEQKNNGTFRSRGRPESRRRQRALGHPEPVEEQSERGS